MTDSGTGPRRPTRLGRLDDALRAVWFRAPGEPEIKWRVRNETPWPIWVDRKEAGVFVLAPFEERLDAMNPTRRFGLEPLLQRHRISVRKQKGELNATLRLSRFLRTATAGALIWLASLAVLPPPVWRWCGAVGGLIVALVLFLLLTRPGRLQQARRFQLWTWQSITMVLVVLVAVVGPGLALWFGTDLYKSVVLTPYGLFRTQIPLELIGRLLQLTLITIASLLPALMFFQYDAERLSTQRARWMQNAFRLDPTLSSVVDVEAKYGRQIEEAYGSVGDRRGRLTRGRRSPLIVATVAITFGWLLILLNADVRVLQQDGHPTLPFTSLLAPAPTVLTYAFLGAYFFGLNLVHNSYVRGDLRPKTYNLITTRILLVVILAWLIQAATDGTGTSNWTTFGLAFLAGLVPRTVLHWLVERLPGKLKLDDGVSTADQLQALDGIDLYERTRLSDEGITTVHALANHDIVDLFFRTRLSAARLVDWVDQSVLLLTLGRAELGSMGNVSDLVKALRAAGVRTATDLLGALASESGRDEVVKIFGRAGPNGVVDDADTRVELVRRAVATSEWIQRIRHWRTSDLIAVRPHQRRYVDRHGDLRPGDPRFSFERESQRQVQQARWDRESRLRANGVPQTHDADSVEAAAG